MQESSIPVFQALFREHYAGVVRKLALLVGDQATAEDLAQDVFLKLYRSPPEDIARVGAWLHRVLTTTAYDYMRQANRRQTLLAKEQARSELEGQAAPSNEETAFHNWEMEMVKRALGRLSGRDRDALLLKQHFRIARTEWRREKHLRQNDCRPAAAYSRRSASKRLSVRQRASEEEARLFARAVPLSGMAHRSRSAAIPRTAGRAGIERHRSAYS